MRKKILFLAFPLLIFTNTKNQYLEEFVQFSKKHTFYQDILYKNKIIFPGTQFCENRFELIRPILNLYDRKFSLLDIGAAYGFFSFRTAEEFNAECTMIQGTRDDCSGKMYGYIEKELLTLCKMNSHLTNVKFLNHGLTLNSLKKLERLERFDIVYAFLVLQFLGASNKGLVSFESVKKHLDLLLKLGNDVIIETSTDVYQELDKYIHKICLDRGGRYLGTLPRKKNKTKTHGKFYWFTKTNDRDGPDAKPINKSTFVKFNGVHPAITNSR